MSDVVSLHNDDSVQASSSIFPQDIVILDPPRTNPVSYLTEKERLMRNINTSFDDQVVYSKSFKDKDDGHLFDGTNEKTCEDIILGQEFIDVESAYKHYMNYGGRHGFDVRIRSNTKNRKKDFVARVHYVCAKEGFRVEDKRRTNKSYSQPITRCGCLAHMIIQMQINRRFQVVTFLLSHNHPLVSSPYKHLLKVNRKISEPQKAHVDDCEYSGFSIKSTVDLMSREVGGGENLRFSDKYYQNYIYKKRISKMKKGDAGAILQYFQKMQSENSSYFYSIQLDEDDMITNIFWVDARSVCDYSVFGDVVCFDTTYRTNEYGRPFVPFVGVNHHKQTTLFGAALLYDETVEFFTWLFENFLSAMSGKYLLTILTDQSAVMARAINDVFPHSTHRLCIWHLYQNAAKNLSHVFHGSSEFANDFSKCMYDVEFESEWLSSWNSMVEKYNLEKNKWLNNLFELREKWALVYGRDTFSADMKSTQRSESMNNVLKKYLKPEHSLIRFLEHYERVLTDRRYQELIAEHKMMYTSHVLAVSAHMLQHGAEVFTPEVFLLFQNEFVRIHNYSTYKVGKSGNISDYIVSVSSGHNEHLVKYEASNQKVDCSCKKFTFVGILSAHALKVLDKKNVKNIPPQYILKRWTREAKTMIIPSYEGQEVHDNPKESIGKRYSYLCRTSRDVAIVGSEDEELGRYAHEGLVKLFKELELIKKKRNYSDVTEKNTHAVEKPILGESEELQGIIQSNASETTIVCGVKRKATVGRPRSRFKDPLEKRKSKAPSKSKTSCTRRKIPMHEFESMSASLDVQPSDVSTQGINDLDVVSNLQGEISFTQLLQEQLTQWNTVSPKE